MFGNSACNLAINYLNVKRRIKSKFSNDIYEAKMHLNRKRADQGRRLNKTVNLYVCLVFQTTVITTLGGIPFTKWILQYVLSTGPL